MLRQRTTFVSQKEESSIAPGAQSEKKLQFSEFRYRRLFETAQDGILILDAASGKITDANPFLKEILGYTEAELLGKELWEIGVFKDIADSKTAFLELQKIGYIRYKDLPLQTKDGRSIDVEFVSNVYMVGDQRVIQCNIRDITDRRKVELLAASRAEDLERLSKSQEETKKAMLNVMEDLEEAKTQMEVEKVKDEAMLASIGEGLIAVGNDRKIMVVNKAAEKILDLSGKDLIGKELTSFPLEDEEGHLLPLTRRPTYVALSTGTMVNCAYFFVRKDGTRFPIAINVTPVKLGGKIIGAVDIFRDITREKEIDKAKSEFVSLASHQLRTPLGISKWYLEAIIANQYIVNAPDKVKEYLGEVYKSNERLLMLVRDLLSISRIDQGKVKNTPRLVRVVQIVKDVIKEMRILALQHKITVHLDVKKSTIPAMSIDVIRLQEVIENLITNAIVYSNPSGTVTITVDQDGDMLIISVRDEGVGIATDDTQKLFTKFFRSESGMIKNTEGTGLGLYVVKSYVEGWGGTIHVESVKGKGSIFTVSLPLHIRKEAK